MSAHISSSPFQLAISPTQHGQARFCFCYRSRGFAGIGLCCRLPTPCGEAVVRHDGPVRCEVSTSHLDQGDEKADTLSALHSCVLSSRTQGHLSTPRRTLFRATIPATTPTVSIGVLCWLREGRLTSVAEALVFCVSGRCTARRKEG